MTQEFVKAALIRAIRTICQTAIATIGTAAVLTDVDWTVVASASILAGILSLLTSVATGLPEADNRLLGEAESMGRGDDYELQADEEIDPE